MHIKSAVVANDSTNAKILETFNISLYSVQKGLRKTKKVQHLKNHQCPLEQE